MKVLRDSFFIGQFYLIFPCHRREWRRWTGLTCNPIKKTCSSRLFDKRKFTFNQPQHFLHPSQVNVDEASLPVLIISLGFIFLMKWTTTLYLLGKKIVSPLLLFSDGFVLVVWKAATRYNVISYLYALKRSLNVSRFKT